jgi:Ca-activated chloride channel family protein
MTTLQLLTPDDITRCCPTEIEGFGALYAPQGNLPLKLMDVQAKVLGLVASQSLRQTFVNTLGMPIEATYVFPLPDRAAVTRFRLEVGERIVEGDLQERGQARRTYDQAIAQGHRAAITEEERPGVFTMRVGNIMPGEEATVWLDLTGPLSWQDGEVTYRFPLVVAPRFVPGTPLAGGQVGSGVAADTDACPDASRISPPVLLPGYPNPVQLSISVELDGAGLALGVARSSLQAISEERGVGHRVVRLQPGARLNQDFVLRFGLGAERIASSFLTQPDPTRPGEGTFMLTLVPPTDTARATKPRDVVFVLDRSGSMGGWKMVAARRATARMVDTLGAKDRFAVYAFDHSIEAPPSLGTALQPASNRNRFRAVEFLAGLDARGGTQMAGPLQQAASQLATADTSREKILVLVTDGQVGNEDQILRRLGADLERIRIFTLGIDRAVNAGFLRRLAGLGGGYCELVESEDRLDDVMDQIHRRIDTPLLTDLSLSAQGGTFVGESLVPGRLPALFAGTPVQILGRYTGGAPRGVAVRAHDAVGYRRWDQDLSASSTALADLGAVWARGQIRQLEDRWVLAHGGAKQSLEQQVVSVSLRHRVLSRFTAFVAVDRSQVVNEGGRQHQVTQAVEHPAGWGQAAESQVDFARSSKCMAPPPASCAPADPFGGGADAFACLDASAAPMGAPFSQAPMPARDERTARRVSAKRGRRKQPKSAARSPQGFFGRLLQGGRADEGKAHVPPVAEWPYRQRSKALLEVLRSGVHETRAMRERLLRRVLGLLVTLVADVQSVGLDARVLAELQAALQVGLRADNELGSNELTHLWCRAEEVLRAYAEGSAPRGRAARPVRPTTTRREGFWK